MHILRLKPANKVVEAARMLPRKTRKARNTGKDAIRAMARKPATPARMPTLFSFTALQEQAAMNRP